MNLLIALALFSQVWVGDVPPATPEDLGGQFYVTAHPIEPTWLGLATRTGRFAAHVSDVAGATTSGVYDCSWVAEGMNLTLVDYAAGVVWVAPTGMEVTESPHCRIHIIGYVDPTPCFQDAGGVCNVAFEMEEQWTTQ